MHYSYAFRLYSLLLVGLLALTPLGAAAQVGGGTLPTTSIIDVPLEECPRLFYLPMIPGIGAARSAAAPLVLPDPPDGNSMPAQLPALDAQLLQDVPIITSTLVYSEATSLWENPSPDPSGLDRYSATSVIVSDSEVNERGAFINIWIFDLESRQVLTSTSTVITNLSTEPTDVALSADGAIVISDDVRREVISAELDENGNLAEMHTFNTTFYGSVDPEGIDIYEKDGSSYLVTADATSNTIYTHYAGVNGFFDGPCAPGDDSVTKFDAGQLGFLQPGGIYAVPDEVGDGVRYYMVGDPDRDYINVVHASGSNAVLVEKIDIGVLDQYKKMAGIVIMDSGQIVLVFRGVDNESDPNENDGILAVIEPHRP